MLHLYHFFVLYTIFCTNIMKINNFLKDNYELINDLLGLKLYFRLPEIAIIMKKIVTFVSFFLFC